LVPLLILPFVGASCRIACPAACGHCSCKQRYCKSFLAASGSTLLGVDAAADAKPDDASAVNAAVIVFHHWH
jgi:hypothetical protein